MPGPCQGLRVVDFSQSHPGALATMVLADAGAEVVKVEPPGGDPSRREPASVMWHRGKKSVVLDLKTARGVDDARRLASGADAVVVAFRPGVVERLGIGFEVLSEANPGLVYCSITGFGEKGPLAGIKGYEGIVQAAAGRFDAFHGMVEKDGPIYGAQRLGSYGAAMLTVHGMMAALRVKEATGRGQKVETSLLQALTCFDIMGSATWHLSRITGEARARGYNGGSSPPYMTGRARDGRWLQFANLTVATQWNFLDALGLTHLLEDPKYAAMPGYDDPAHGEEVRRLCLEKILEKDSGEWLRIAMTSDFACEPFRNTQQGLQHEQAVHNGDVIDLRDPALGPMKQLGPIARFSRTPVAPQGPPPPVGHDSFEELLRPAASEAAPSAGGPLEHPLSGVTVMEFATYIATPFLTALLSDLGARVIKVEPVTGDLLRASAFPKNAKCLQGKEALSLDLKDPRGQEVVHRLVEKTDILVHNFRPGAPERLRIDYRTLREINPRLIYIYAGAYGSTGPHSHRTGFHPIAGAITGTPILQLGTALPPPADKPMTLDEVYSVSVSMSRANEGNPDPVSSLACGAAAMMALRSRGETGPGQYIETSMIGLNFYAHAEEALAYEGKPSRPLTDEGYNGVNALYRLYRAREGWIFLASPSEAEWQALARAAGLDELLSDSRFSSPESRLVHDAPLAEALQHTFLERTASEWQAVLGERDVACVEVFDGDCGTFFQTAPWMKEAGLMSPVEHPSMGGAYWRHAPPYIFSLTPGQAGTSNYLGEHTASIMRELGFSGDRIDEMLRDGTALYTPRETGQAAGALGGP